MSIADSESEKDSVWQPWLEKYFPNGVRNDPEFCPLRFEAEKGRFYIDGEMSSSVLTEEQK